MKQLKIGFCAADKVGKEIVDFATKQKQRIEFIATSERDKSIYEYKISKICQEREIELYRKINVNNPEFINEIQKRGLDLMILAWWPQIVKKEAINSVKIGWINTHPSFLPYGRGKHPYYWTIVEETPFGVSLHFIDEGTDSGPVLFQREIKVNGGDTGGTLYKKSCNEVVDLFKEVYGEITTGKFKSVSQPKNTRLHLGSEIEEHSRINLDERYNARELLNILRGRSFSQGKRAAYFLENGKRYNVKITIEEDEK